MKPKIKLTTLSLIIMLLIINSSCVVIVPRHHKNPHHYGWHKQKNKRHQHIKRSNIYIITPEKKSHRR